MATFAEIKTRVETIIIDLPTAVQALSGTFVNAALVRLQRKHNFKVMETVGGPYSTTVGSRTLVAVPSDFKEVRSKPFRVTELGAVTQMETVADRASANTAWGIGTIDIGAPWLVLQSEPNDAGGSNWEVVPTPDGAAQWANGEYRIYVPYWRFVAALSGASDTNWFTTHAEEYLIKQAAADGFYYDWDEERGNLWLARAEKEYQEVVLADKRARLAGVDTFVPLHGGANSPRVRL